MKWENSGSISFTVWAQGRKNRMHVVISKQCVMHRRGFMFGFLLVESADKTVFTFIVIVIATTRKGCEESIASSIIWTFVDNAHQNPWPWWKRMISHGKFHLDEFKFCFTLLLSANSNGFQIFRMANNIKIPSTLFARGIIKPTAWSIRRIFLCS